MNLLRYRTVRETLGWKTNDSIKKAIKAGKLVRVCVGNGSNSYRITADSMQSFLAARRHNDADEKADLARAAARTAKMRAAKRLPVPDSAEVLLDPAAIIDSFNAGRHAMRTPVHKPTLDEVIQSTPAPQAQRPDWRERNRWIEGGCVGPDPWASRPRFTESI
jgi:hypothetical protein